MGYRSQTPGEQAGVQFGETLPFAESRAASLDDNQYMT